MSGASSRLVEHLARLPEIAPIGRISPDRVVVSRADLAEVLDSAEGDLSCKSAYSRLRASLDKS